MIRRLLLGLALLASASCGDFPRDPENTLERVRAERRFSVGMVSSAAGGPEEGAAALLARLAAATGARPQVEHGQAEPLLTRLENGEIDLVIGRFSAASPWSRLVSFGPPLRIVVDKGTEFHVAAAARNGENGWIALIERESREAGAGMR